MTHRTQLPTSVREDRALTADERSLLRWMLEHGESFAAPYLAQIDRARVCGRCGCGCASIDFAIEGPVEPAKAEGGILADFAWRDDEGHRFGAFVFSDEGFLGGLEVYSVDGAVTPAWLPKPEQLELLPVANPKV